MEQRSCQPSQKDKKSFMFRIQSLRDQVQFKARKIDQMYSFTVDGKKIIILIKLIKGRENVGKSDFKSISLVGIMSSVIC